MLLFTFWCSLEKNARTAQNARTADACEAKPLHWMAVTTYSGKLRYLRRHSDAEHLQEILSITLAGVEFMSLS